MINLSKSKSFPRVNLAEPSVESRVQTSETYDLNHYEKTSIVSYKNHVKVAKSLVYLICGAVFAVCLVLPYAWVYHVSEIIVTNLIAAGMKYRVKALANLIGVVMSKVEIITFFWEDMTRYPLYYGLEKEMVPHILSWAGDAEAAVRPSPIDYVVCDGLTYLQVSYLKTGGFYLYYSLPTNDPGIVEIRRYGSETDFEKGWDPATTGEPMKNVNVSALELSVTPNTWVNSYEFLMPSGSSELQMGFVTRNGDVYVGATLSLNDLYNVIMMTLPGVSTFALLDKEWGVSLVGDIGPIAPISTENGATKYPHLNEINSTIWTGVWESLQTEPDDETLLTIKIGEVNYYMYVTNVSSSLGSNGKFVFIINHDELLQESYLPISIVFLLEIVSMVLLLFLLLWCLRFVQERLHRKLTNKKPQLSMGTDLQHFGAVGKAIYVIRHLQLLYPEQRTLNSVLDRVVEHIAEQPTKHFEKLKGTPNCGFCNHLIQQPPVHTKKQRTEEYPYSTWKKSVKKLADFTPKLSLSEIEANPKRRLLKFMMTTMEARDLLFDFADPDSFLRFVDDFAENHCRDVVFVVMALRQMYKLLRSSFRYWIFDRLELFAVYIAILVDEIAFKKTKEEKLFKDRISRHIFKMQHIKELLKHHFPMIEKDSEGIYFLDFLNRLIESLDPKISFELMGLLRTRMEVSNFSVTHSRTDRVLFAANLIRLCQFAPYFCEDEMDKGAGILAYKFLSQREREDETFAASFHYVTIRSVVRRLLDIFQLFKPIKEMDDVIQNAERYWGDKCGELGALHKYTNSDAHEYFSSTDTSSVLRRDSLLDQLASPKEMPEASSEIVGDESMSVSDSDTHEEEEETEETQTQTQSETEGERQTKSGSESEGETDETQTQTDSDSDSPPESIGSSESESDSSEDESTD